AGCPDCQRRLGLRSQPPPSSDADPRPFPFLDPPREPGEIGRLGAYRILNVLGVGGMAIVFDAEDDALHRQVAVKIMRPEMCDAAARERFLREARAIAKLPHDHVVTVYEVGEHGKMPFLAMERLRGISLEERLLRDHWLPLAEALQIAREAAEGLVVAHDAGMVHRDIKPANIWLEAGSTPGTFKRVKLIAFGIARISMTQSAALPTPGQVIGTPAYMAPEQAAGRPVDVRADLYSLGCVLYRMLTGKTPFADQDDNTLATLQAVIRGEPGPIHQLAPD